MEVSIFGLGTDKRRRRPGLGLSLVGRRWFSQFGQGKSCGCSSANAGLFGADVFWGAQSDLEAIQFRGAGAEKENSGLTLHTSSQLPN
jgi:hypothetical protein